ERTTVLLSGESGTGRGWVARQLHELSERSAAPFVEASCTGTPAEVLESLVFGHEKGSGGGGMGSDSRQRQIGLLEVAEGGTIFFDEIGDLPAVLQPKLLNVIETKKFRRAGGTREIALDVRMVAATSYDLEVEVRAGRFREDLLYRLSVMPLRLPPLRERTRADRLALVTGLITDLRAELPGSP